MHSLSNLASLIAVNPDILSALKFIAVFFLVALIYALFCRLFRGSESGMNRALSASIGILFVYIVTVIIYTFNPYNLSKLLAPLPFISFRENTLILLSFQNTSATALCSQILSMFILALLVNLFDGIMPTGKRLFIWYVWRTLTVLLSMALHYGICWVFNTFLPGVLVTYAPAILLWTLLGLFFIGFLNIFLSLLLTVISPIFGAIYGFFFSNSFGKQFSKALVSTLILCIIILVLNHFGCALIVISPSALQAYLPVILGLLIIWYIVGHI